MPSRRSSWDRCGEWLCWRRPALGLPVAEYAPLKIKSSVVGYGLAKKEQVQFMVARLLGLAEVPEPADAADALAIAICHIHTAQTLAMQGPAQRLPARRVSR